jgi:phosphocarrier protein FPr
LNFFNNIFRPPPQRYTTLLTITSPNGFHLRPIASFVNRAKLYSEEITLSTKNSSADAKSINSILALTLQYNDKVELCVVGDEPKDTLYELVELFETIMDREPKTAPTLKLPIDDEVIPKDTTPYPTASLRGHSISDGIAIAPLYSAKVDIEEIDTNLSFQEALHNSIKELDNLYTQHRDSPNSSIYLTHKSLLEDNQIADIESIDEFNLYIKEHIQSLKATSFDARRSDYLDIQKRILSQLGQSTTLILPDTPSILFADDLLPSDISTLVDSSIVGVVLKKSSLLSHSAILLKSFGIPSVVIRDNLRESDKSILDASLGLVIVEPTDEDIDIANDRVIADGEIANIAYQKRFESATTRDNKKINIVANITDLKSAKDAKEQGAEGIGLLRSEFIFQEREPTVEEQTKVYKDIFRLFDSVTIRTLDVGGDKKLPYINIASEDNPFLGIRGVRLFESHPELIERHLKAILKASRGRPLNIMFPMVSTPKEFTNAKTTTIKIAQKYKLSVERIKFGIMIEVPSVIFLMEEFNTLVDFYSIGTNDLTQYLFAIERTHSTLHINPLSDVIFDVLEMIYKRADKPISICGEIASIPQASKRLIEIGFSSLSITPSKIPLIKETIRNI